MNIFKLHDKIISDYKDYIESFLLIKDKRIKEIVEGEFMEGKLWPEPLIQFNPTFEQGTSVEQLVKEGVISSHLNQIFKGYNLYRHQVEAIRRGAEGKSFIVTSGTGSGKSLTFLATIFSDLLKKNEYGSGVKAILVYPMNALINSQEEEIKKYKENYETETKSDFPLTFKKYTGQETLEQKQSIKSNPPDIILTNYMMLELIMTRASEAQLRESIFDNLKYLVFDELHTYRGRQGADVSLLIRRIHASTLKDVTCIGTSATMASAGTRKEQKQTVAKVGKQIFDKDFTVDQIIGEYLENTTISDKVDYSDLKKTVKSTIDISGSPSSFVSNPLAIWLENKVALETVENGFVKRAKPRTLNAIANQLSEDTGFELALCKQKLVDLLNWAEALNEQASKMKNRKSYLPFKFHQFIAQTGNVSVSMERPADREITIDNTLYFKDGNKEVFAYPVLFSRFSGHEFICVKKNYEHNYLERREPIEIPDKITKSSLKGNRKLGTKKKDLLWTDVPEGYILFDNGSPVWNDSWNSDLPESWLLKDGETLDSYYEKKVPQMIWIGRDGSFSEVEDKNLTQAWFIPCHMLLDPTAGVIYDHQVVEYTKLMKLGNEGRSTATTVLSLSTIKALKNQGISDEYQKLLSFTDNRQDASLQSGHFNDFISTIKLRAALYQALLNSENGLTASNVGNKTRIELDLKEEEYARRPSANPRYVDEENERLLEEYLFFRIIYDLKRGWRYNTPNLEQCALLHVEYKTAKQLSEDVESWKDLEFMNELSAEERYEIIYQVASYFRTSFALDHRKLEANKRAEIANEVKDKLRIDTYWCFDEGEQIDPPLILTLNGIGKIKKGIEVGGCGPMSAVGKYFKRLFQEKLGKVLYKGEELGEYLRSFYQILVSANILHEDEVVGKDGTTMGYQLRLDQVKWKLGDEKNPFIDKIRIKTIANKEFSIERTPNTYFQNYYKEKFGGVDSDIRGAEHTGQLSSLARQERETKFREGELSALFCSPTMELGIDISSMNVVHMRNVPPGPANYAQRSGRAGRSGQTALVMTYCSNFSPHDRNYFNNASEMVAGEVVEPKIDLTNKELIKSHFNSYIFMELRMSSIKSTVAEVLDLSIAPEYPVKEELKEYIKEQINQHKDLWISKFKRTLKGMLPELAESSWYTENILELVINDFYKTFDSSFNRWRSLYRNANNLLDQARSVIDNSTIKASAPQKKDAKRDQWLAEQQRELLLNNSDSTGSNSEFYIFRYLASEGFLPGYNFTRLPIRTHIGSKDRGEFISRPRFVALYEFGPNNMIYHMGNKYRVNRMMLSASESQVHRLKISKTTGYVFLDNEIANVNNDPLNNRELSGEDNVELKTNILELSEGFTKSVERISSQEEERTKAGFDVEHYFSFSEGLANTIKCTLRYEGDELLELRYGPSARLLKFNRKWRRSKPGDDSGYSINMKSGYWKGVNKDSKQEDIENTKKVHVYTTDTADVIYIQPLQAIGLEDEGVVTLTYALKRAIEKVFQIEESELGAWVMGSGENKNILIYEAAESSLGILSELIKNPEVLKQVFKTAYELCYFNVETKKDDKPEALKASYDDLLSYYNQIYHNKIDRHLIKEGMEKLIYSKIESTKKNNISYEDQYQFLLRNYDRNSSTELRFIEFLYEAGLALPDKAQLNLQHYYISADFVYENKAENSITYVFVDGSVHDDPEVAQQDRTKRNQLDDDGHDFIVWRYDEPLEDLVNRRSDIFRKVIEK